jgi:hypothetical protein
MSEAKSGKDWAVAKEVPDVASLIRATGQV